MGHTTMLCGICVLSLLCLLSISSVVADTTPQREINCTAVLIEAEARRESEVSAILLFFSLYKIKFDVIFLHLLVCFDIFKVLNSRIVCMRVCVCVSIVDFRFVESYLYGNYNTVHVFINKIDNRE